MNFNSQPRPPALTPGCDRPAVSPRTLPSVETAGRPLLVRKIGAYTAALVVEREHYLRRKPPISFAFGLYEHGDLVGVITFGTPASRHMQKGACPSDPSKALELNRLWVSDAMPRNTETWFLSRALSILPPLIVLSYADTAQGHAGYVYRAANFFYAGWTDMERKTPRFDYVAPGKHSRDAFRNGYAAKVRRKPKVKYWTVTGDRRARRELMALMKWPRMCWKANPPPFPSLPTKAEDDE